MIRFSIPVISAASELRASRIETIPARRVSTAPAHVIASDGGAQLSDSARTEVSLDYSNNLVEAQVCLSAERAAARLLVSGCRAEFLYTTDPDSVIEGTLGSTRSAASGAGDRAANVRGSQTGLVRRWVFTGSPPAVVDKVEAQLNRVQVVSTPGDGCVSPIVYAEARRTSVISPETSRAFDPKLKRVDRRIVTLRPRFAPQAPQREQRDQIMPTRHSRRYSGVFE